MLKNFDHVLRITRKQQGVKSVCLKGAASSSDIDAEELLLTGNGRLDLSGDSPRLVASPKFSNKTAKRQQRARQLFRHEMEHLVNIDSSRIGANGLANLLEEDRDSMARLVASEDVVLTYKLHNCLEKAGFKWTSEATPQENVAKALEIIVLSEELGMD